jgi:hypothetical protein
MASGLSGFDLLRQGIDPVRNGDTPLPGFFLKMAKGEDLSGRDWAEAGGALINVNLDWFALMQANPFISTWVGIGQLGITTAQLAATWNLVNTLENSLQQSTSMTDTYRSELQHQIDIEKANLESLDRQRHALDGNGYLNYR